MRRAHKDPNHPYNSPRPYFYAVLKLLSEALNKQDEELAKEYRYCAQFWWKLIEHTEKYEDTDNTS